MTDLEKFLAKIDRSGPPHERLGSPCWAWTAHRLATGYPRFGKGYAHRWSYEHYVGPIPDRHSVDHRCHNRGCVNPDHLRAATRRGQQENLSGANSASRSGIRGVRWSKGAWEANVKVNGKVIYLGRYPTAEAAEQAAIAGRVARFTLNDVDRA